MPVARKLTDEASLFTIVLDYRGGTYLRQIRASSVKDAIREWAKSDVWDSIPQLRRSHKRTPSAEFLTRPIVPVAVEGITGVWCVDALVRANLAIVHAIETTLPRITRQSTAKRGARRELEP